MSYEIVREHGVLKLVIGHQRFHIGPSHEDYLSDHGVAGYETALVWWESQVRKAMDRLLEPAAPQPVDEA